MNQKISPSAINALKKALTYIYWYKNRLKSFLEHTLDNRELLVVYDWSDEDTYKRHIVSDLVDRLKKKEEQYQDELLNLIRETINFTDFSHLETLEDGEQKVQKAQKAVEALRKEAGNHYKLMEKKKKRKERRKKAKKRREQTNLFKQRLDELNDRYMDLLMEDDHQKRGHNFEQLLRDLFELFDLDPKNRFQIDGEQIDGAFTMNNTDYLVEAKWQQQKVSAKQLDSLNGKLERKLENTLGLFISIEGFSEGAVTSQKNSRSLMLLMSGRGLTAVLEDRIDLRELIRRKRRHAAQKGDIFLRIDEILSG